MGVLKMGVEFLGLFLLGGSGDEYLSILNGSDRRDRLVVE